jgi:hypothetical protein
MSWLSLGERGRLGQPEMDLAAPVETRTATFALG